MKARTRFAPSPSGLLHLGHAFSALAAWEAAGADRERFVLRIEDIDMTRCRPEFEEAIYEDLAWLGFSWCEPVLRQSERMDVYADALEQLKVLGVVYPCFCTRRDIQEEIARSVQAPHGPDGKLYPGICRGLSAGEQEDRLAAGDAHSWRLNVEVASRHSGPLRWHDQTHGSIAVESGVLGDVVIARKDIGTSYHLAVVVDDANQEIELVTRGLDLFHATHVHRLLQELLQLPVPQWFHHALIADSRGQRLAKRNDAESIRAFREAGRSPEEFTQWARSAMTCPSPVSTS